MIAPDMPWWYYAIQIVIYLGISAILLIWAREMYKDSKRLQRQIDREEAKMSSKTAEELSLDDDD